MIDCSATVDGVVYMTEIPFYLQVTQGITYSYVYTPTQFHVLACVICTVYS